MTKTILFLLLSAVTGLTSSAQRFNADYTFLSGGNGVEDKIFYFLVLLERLDATNRALSANKDNRALFQKKRQAIGNADLTLMMRQALYDSAEARQAANILMSLDAKTRNELVQKHLLPSGYFIRYEKEGADSIILSALCDALRGIDHIINVYGLGAKGRYPQIDSANYNVSNPAYRDSVSALGKNLDGLADMHKLFFTPSLRLAMQLLSLNKYDHAARYEPLVEGENKKAAEKLRSGIKWDDYPYAAILAPGNGPEGPEPLSEKGKERLAYAIERYNKRLAPFIIVSGGNAHPFNTPYNEAMEMKKELMRTYRLPESDIIIEPHARHTTTNIRNANRILYRFGFLAEKPLLITTDTKQAEYIRSKKFESRCLNELGYIPFYNLHKISEIDTEYLPVIQSLYIDARDPLDP